MSLKGKTWPQMVSVAIIALGVIVHAIYFDHWGTTFIAPLQALARYLGMDISHSLQYVGTAAGSSVIVMAVWCVGYFSGVNSPRRFFWGYAVMVLLAEFWFCCNHTLMWQEVATAFGRFGTWGFLNLSPTALVHGVFAGILYQVLRPLDMEHFRTGWNTPGKVDMPDFVAMVLLSVAPIFGSFFVYSLHYATTLSDKDSLAAHFISIMPNLIMFLILGILCPAQLILKLKRKGTSPASDETAETELPDLETS